jgi:hypothetical protein
MKIEDDFLDQENFNRIQQILIGGSSQFPWSYADGIVRKEVDKFQFTHVFYIDSAPNNDSIELVTPIIEILNPTVIMRIKANLLTKTPKIVENEFHTDFKMSEEKLKHWTTSIFYVNTNNGYTVFEDGTKVESVANRMLTFPSNLKHCGTSCTDKNIRSVINFNYLL